MARLRKMPMVLRGRGPWRCLKPFYEYKRDPEHTAEKHVEQLDTILKIMEPYYIIRSSLKRDLVISKMTKWEARVMGVIWEGLVKDSISDTLQYDIFLARYKRYCQQKPRVDTNVKRVINYRRKVCKEYPWLLKASSLPRVIIEISKDE